MENGIIKDYLEIIQDIEIHDNEKGNILSWIYRHTLYKYYKKRLNKSISNLDIGLTLSKDNVQELIYYIANTFASENGKFYPILDAKMVTFNEGTSEQYTMYSAILRLGNNYAEIKTYSDSPTVEVIYHDNIIDMKSKSSTFTFNGDKLAVKDKGQRYKYRLEKIFEVNDELIWVIQQYLRYCLNGNEEGE